jgi:hypothetical protein
MAGSNGLNGMSAMSALQKQEMLKQAQLVPPQIRKFIARHALSSQVMKKQVNYYSVVRFPFSVVPIGSAPGVPGSFRYTLAKKLVTAFSYGNGGEDMTAAGFAANYRSNDADTNLVTRNDTGGAVVEIHGISLHLSETSDAFLAKLIWADAFADITLNGSVRHTLLGRLGRISSPGGLYGSGESRAVTPGAGESVAHVGSMTNGMPHANNYYKLADKIRWNPASMQDSKFQLRIEVKRDITFDVNSRAASPGVTDYSPPTTDGAIGTFVDIVVYLHTREISPRSKQG